MLTVETIARIRRDHLVRGVPIKKLAVNGGEIMYRRGGAKLCHGLGGSLSP